MHYSWNKLFDNYVFEFKDYNNIYPPKEYIFKVFDMDVSEIRIVLLGQDPYHNYGQAHGLSFSVEHNIQIPPSLKNIFKEINIEFPDRHYNFIHGNLNRWFYEEKIFLLNTSLTVKKNKPNSHNHIWKEFTDDVIKYICDNNDNCIFILLGNYAKSKSNIIKNKKIICSHPSPLSAYNGFFNSNVFINTEILLGYKINWIN